ncbi:MAG TPA: methyltransferase domain-containing protein [Terriglobales bacterium]
MSKRVCPWWLGYFLASPLRRLITDPHKLLSPYVHDSMTVLEPGPGMGFFTLELARLVGQEGRVIAPDVQEKMLTKLRQKARKAGLLSRIEARLVPSDTMQLDDVAGQVGFTLAYAVVHELPSAAKFFEEAGIASKKGAILLLVEPSGHVNEQEFADELRLAGDAGFAIVERPGISGTHAAVLRKQ